MFKLPDLPYSYSALEPSIDEATMKLHHDKHHAGYVEKLNNALSGKDEFLSMPINELLSKIDTVPELIRQAVINNGGGHANHTLFWEIMTPGGDNAPSGDLLAQFKSTFSEFENFKKEFTERAMAVFGSGWVFLVVDKVGGLKIKRQSFQNSPFMKGMTPILALDVWEHAYYLKYQNRRADYLEAWWKVVNWSKVVENLHKISD
jgi:Fe-Mn family superoxide dismutase